MITGLHGYNLGDKLKTSNIIQTIKTAANEKQLQVKVPATAAAVKSIVVSVNTDNIIYLIKVTGKPATAAKCSDDQSAFRRGLEKKFPALGYYAMDDITDMFYEPGRTLTLTCINDADRQNVIYEYYDENIGKK